MNQLPKVIVLGMLLAWPTSAADFLDGKTLYKFWLEWKKAEAGTQSAFADRAFFNGYVSGVSDANEGTFLSVPPGVTIGQLGRVVGRYLDEHPEELSLPASAIVLKALVKVYPPKLDQSPPKTLEKERPPDE